MNFSRFILCFALLIFGSGSLFGQVSGTKAIPTDYATIAAFITDINTNGIGSGGVTLNIPSGYTETAPVGGFSITATGTAANPIIIQKSGVGANPVLTAYTGGTGTPGAAVQDGIFSLVGSDYVTIDGIDLMENASNTANPATMEYGFGLFKASATNGCQFNTIQHCTVTLSIVNNASGSSPAVDGSRGINIVNSLITTQTTSVTVTAAGGSNSNNKVYSNTIKNTNIGIVLFGFSASSPFTLGDTSNDIGGVSAATGNTIVNFGGAASASNPAAGIRTQNQWSQNISYNTLNNNDGTGANHVSTLRGIFIQAATSANATVSNNSITLVSGGTGSQLDGISNAAGSTAASNTININNNVIRMAYSTATSAVMNGIVNSGTPATLNINGNTITNVPTLPALQNTLGGTGNIFFIEGGSPTVLNMNNNTITAFARTGSSGTWRGLKFTSPTTGTISGNTVENLAWSAPGSTGGIDGIYGLSSSVDMTITNNIVRNLSIPGTGTINGIREWGSAGNKTITGNQVYGFATTSGGAGGATFNGIFASIGNIVMQNNVVYNLVSTGSSGGTGGTVTGLQVNSGTFSTAVIRENKVYDLSSTSTGVVVSGIYSNTGVTTTIQNNLIGDLKAPAANLSNAIIGINIAGGTTANVYYNTVNIAGTSSGAVFGTSAIFAATGPTLNMNNNVFVNSATSTGAGLSAAYRRGSITLTSYGSGSNRNNFSAPVIFTDGTNTDVTLGAYQTRVSTRDANSLNVVPNFISTVGGNAGFLHINTALPTALESAGSNIGSITIDYDGDTRQGNGGYTGTGTAPDLGADEFELAVVNCSTANGGTISPTSASICTGATRTMTATGATNLNGISYQWKMATVSGGPYVNVSGGTGATTTSYTTSAMTAGTYYFVMEATCSFGPVTGLSNEFTLVVNPNPTVSVSPASASYCNPGPGVGLTANGASTYAWSPATGLSAATGSAVTATPSATTTYTVLGIDGNGCSNTATTTINVSNTPVITSVTATPSAVCDGSDSQLAAIINVPYNSGASAYAFAGSTGTYTAITGTTLGSSAIGDDVGIGNLPIGFTFPYNGTTFTVFGARSNGLIELGQTGATLSGFSANSLSTNANCIAPLWDDNNTTGGSIIYTTTGTAPNRVLTVQWTGMHVAGSGSSSNPTIDCQVRLYETTGVIELVYGPTSAALSSPTASIGISGAAGNYLSVTPLSPANTSTVSSSTENGSVSSAANFPSGTVYTFTPPPVPTLTYAWSPSTNLSATNIANPVATGVTAPITYNVIATAASGCSVNGSVSLTVNPLPSAPTGVNSAQCGTQIPTASVTSTSGVPTPTFVWYDALTGGNLVQSSTSTTLTSNVSATTTFGVAELSAAGCESARIPVTVTVATADAISATASSTSICLGASVTLNSANLNPTPVQNYTYSWLSTTGSGAETPMSGATVSVTPTAVGTYTYTVTATDGGCAASESATVQVNELPVLSAATAAPATVCSGDNITVSANAISANDGPFAVGAGANIGSSDYYSPFYHLFGGVKEQYIIPASELTAAGLTAGNITSVALNIGTIGSTYAGFTIHVGTTASADLSAGLSATTLTQVYSNSALTLTASSLNTFTFAAPFFWDGTSNLIVQTSWSNNNGGGTSSEVRYDNTAYVATAYYRADNQTVAAILAGTPATGTRSTRPKLTFGMNHNNSYTWSWAPGTGLNTPTATASVTNTSGSATTQAFTVTATNIVSGCATTATTPLVTINAATPAPAANNSTQCGTMTPTASVTGTGTPGNTFSWYTVPTGGTAITGQTGSSLSAYPVSATTTFYVSESNGTCSSARTPVTVTVTAPPAISIAGTTTICNGSSTALTVSSSNDPNYTYTWTGGLGTGATVTASPTANTSYTVTATDASGGANNGCVTTAVTSITVNPLPQTFPVTPATAAICNGAVQQLTVPVAAGGTAVLGTGTTAPGTTSFPNPLSAYYGGTKHQILFTAAELTAQGMTVGSKINSLAFDLNAFAANACTNFTIRMGNTAVTALTGFVGGTTTVYGPTTFTPSAAGLVTFTLVTPYTWDGTSNIVVETVHNAGNTGNGSGTRTNTTTTAANTVFYGSSDNVAGGIAGFDALSSWGTSGASNLRPNMRFVYTNIQPEWSPAASLYTNAGATTSYVAGTLTSSVYAKPTTTTTYIATYTGANGCTAQTTATITVNQPTSSSVSVTACDSYTWAQNNSTYTSSGAYTAVVSNALGCDSTITLNLTINNSTTATVTQTACGSYTWPINNTTYTASGTHTATISNALGCDSVITLNLTINNPTSATVNQMACQTYTWPVNNTTYTTSGTYTGILTNALGCDSVITLNLTIGGPSAVSVPVTACGSYVWPQTGLTYNTSGSYNDTVPNMFGCDSVITLSLTINQPTSATVLVSECTSYTWPQNGTVYTVSGMYNDTIVNALGCDSVVTLDLTIIQPTTSSVSATACSSYQWAQNGMTYTTSGMYNDTISNASGCDSIITLNLTIIPFAVTATDNGDATITASAGTAYQWINCTTNTPIAGATAQTFTATVNGTYAAVVSNGTCSDTTNCVVIDNVGIKEHTISAISVHPNPTHDVVVVTMDAASAVVEVMDVQGKLVQTTQIKSGDPVDLSAYERGVYTLRIKTDTGTSIERIVKN